MRKYGFLSALFYICFSMMFLYVDDPASGGGEGDSGAGEGDPGNLEIGDPAGENNPDEKSGTVNVSQEEWDRVNGVVDDIERENVFNSTVTNIKSEIPDFNESAVVNALTELHKTNPEKAAQYNSEAGFKAIWYELEKNAAKNDATNDGVNKGIGDADFASLMDDVNSGKRGALAKALDKTL